MSLYLELLETPAAIEIKILNEIAKVLNKQVNSRKNKIEQDIRIEAKNQLILSETYTSLLDGGILNAIFGFVPGEGGRKVYSIVLQLCDMMNVAFSPFISTGRKFTGGITLNFVPDDLQAKSWGGDDFIRINNKYFFAIPWLKTLLFDGDTVSFALNYDVQFIPGRGRSGQAVMVKSSAQWMIPFEHAGTAQNNWFIRELQTPAFQQSISNILEKNLSI